MKCNISHIKDNSGIEYWCLSHKSKADNLACCDCNYKNRYENIIEMKPEEIKSIQIIYPDLNENTHVDVFINNQEFNGILKIKNSIINLKDYGGFMLSKLNHIILKSSVCPYCGGIHTDNGNFAYTPHSEHLCIYCGHLYKVEEANIGNEIALYFNFPDIDLEDNIVLIDEKCKVSYDFFTGDLFVNSISCKKVQFDNQEIELVSFLNDVLKSEY